MLSDKTVLLVEDDNYIRELMSKFLGRYFGQVIQAENGLDGFDKYETCRPHLIISDILMPIMDGTEMVQRLKEKYSGINVIFLTAHGESDKLLSISSLLNEKFLTKPVRNELLLDTIHSMLSA